MKKRNSIKIKIGIYLCALLMMGVIAVSSNIANIIAVFPEAGQTKVITALISVPCLIVIPMTIITGKLMDFLAKKLLMILGVVLWLAGGCIPYFLNSLTGILVMRCIFGLGLGLVMTVCSALVVENFEDPAERDRTMGTMTSFQMLGAIIFSVLAGNLGSIRWNLAFLVHLIALISLVGAIFMLPYKKPERKKDKDNKTGFEPSGMMWLWCISFLIFMLAGQAYSNYASSIITEQNLGGASAAGYSLALFSLGGLIMGFLFAFVAKAFRRLTLSFGCVLLGLSYVIMALAGSLAVSYAGAILCGLSFSICMPCILNGAGNSVKVTSAAFAVSIATCMQNAGQALSPYVISALGIRTTFGSLTANQGAMIAAAVIICVFAILFAFINLRNKKDK